MANSKVKSIYTQTMAENEPAKLTRSTPKKLAVENIHRTKDLNKDLSKDSSKDLSKDTKQDVKQDMQKRSHNLPTTDEVEEMGFRFRKEPKIRINADFPEDWKKELDEYAHQAGVGKYHLVMYAVGKMLGKI